MGCTIIYLNGPSSAGKSTIARALQERLPEPYLHVSIDALIEQWDEPWVDQRGLTGPRLRVQQQDPVGDHE